MCSFTKKKALRNEKYYFNFWPKYTEFFSKASENSLKKKIEACKRLRQELADLKHKMDSQHNINEESTAIFKRKHNETIAELSAHMEVLSKSKLK